MGKNEYKFIGLDKLIYDVKIVTGSRNFIRVKISNTSMALTSINYSTFKDAICDYKNIMIAEYLGNLMKKYQNTRLTSF